MNGDLVCPIPDSVAARVTMAHGAGGAAMQRLVRTWLEGLGAAAQGPLHDAAVLAVPGAEGRLAFTTDGHVVSPLRFPGGDIGALAVYGTVNDLAAAGARPLALSCGLIIEEGFPLARLHEVARSMGCAAREAGVRIVTGDTKVVARGEADGLYVHTAGLGWVAAGTQIAPHRIAPGDVVLLTGDVGRHGIAVLGQREQLGFEGAPPSDLAPLWPLTEAAIAAGGEAVHCMRDLTRGGLASALNELAREAGVRIEIELALVPVHPAVAAACELYGLDPLYVACEGRAVLFVTPERAQAVRRAVAAAPHGGGAVEIGRVQALGEGEPPEVIGRSPFGGDRVLDLLEGEQLPRIC